jgi:hypothetical protein
MNKTSAELVRTQAMSPDSTASSSRRDGETVSRFRFRNVSERLHRR